MGRTVLPYSQVWEAEGQRWQKFRRALRQEDQAHLDRLFESGPAAPPGRGLRLEPLAPGVHAFEHAPGAPEGPERP